MIQNPDDWECVYEQFRDGPHTISWTTDHNRGHAACVECNCCAMWKSVNILCRVCGLPFSQEEWDIRHSDKDGEDVHEDCCVICGNKSDICSECGEPFICSHCGKEMIHHDMFGIAWCPEVYWGEPTVCLVHKRFVPCRSCGKDPEHKSWSSDPAHVAWVRAYQQGESS